MSIRHNGKVIAGASQYRPDLFDWKWADHQLDDVQWLRADTFSWQSGAVYESAYQHLVDDISGKTAQTETIAGVAISFYLADDKHKITTDESAVAQIYAATGVAWYYVLDTTNQRFKLPHAKHNKYANNLSVVGNGMTMAFTNGSVERVISASAGSGGYVDAMWGANGVGQNVSTSNLGTLATNGTWGLTPNAQHSGVIAQQTQDTDQYKYLYFYVGEFTQTALENTAGLNAELFNGKADLNLLNTANNIDFVIEQQEPTAANNYIWYRKYRSGWVEQGILRIQDAATFTFPIAMASTEYSVLGTTMVGAGEVKAASVRQDFKTTTSCVVYFSSSSYYGYVEVRGMAA